MKIKMYSLYSKLISFCLVLLGFSACDTEIADEYGTPSAKFKVTGKVVSADVSKKAVKNIRVIMVEDVNESKQYLRGDTVLTDTDGKFEVNRDGFPTYKFKIKLQDADGEANGQFEEKQQKIEFQSSDFKGGNSWYSGEAQKDLGTIELTPKQENK